MTDDRGTIVCQECRLGRIATSGGDGQWICPKCRLRVLAPGSLARLLSADFVDRLRRRIDAGPAFAGAPCPSCRRAMGRVAIARGDVTEDREIEVDACRVHAAFDPCRHLPSVGASGGVSALLVFIPRVFTAAGPSRRSRTSEAR